MVLACLRCLVEERRHTEAATIAGGQAVCVDHIAGTGIASELTPEEILLRARTALPLDVTDGAGLRDRS